LGRNSTIPTIFDFCIQIDVSQLKRWGFLKPNTIVTGTVSFEKFFSSHVTVSFTAYNDPLQPYLELYYTIQGIEFHYRVYFHLQPSNLGNGFVWYFLCPYSNAKCRKLYLINGRFQHRTAHKEGYYQTQTLGMNDKFLIREFDKTLKAETAYSKMRGKFFRTHYKGKPTKRYLKFLEQIKAADGISQIDLMMK